MNPAPFPTGRPGGISVTEPLGPAFERVKVVLFRPFDLGRWFAIGFCAWLAELGRGGFHGNTNFGGGNGKNAGQALEQARHYFLNNLQWIIPLAVVVFIIALAVGLALLWLGSRGQFMFLNCVALNKAEVKEPWAQYRREGNSLFLFRLVLGLIGAVLMIPIIVVIAILIISMTSHNALAAGALILVIGLTVAMIGLVVILAIIQMFTIDFVVPIMFLRRNRCREAWREAWTLIKSNTGQFLLYMLFKMVLAMAIGTAIFMVVLVTCCIAGCFLAVPYLGTVLLLPVLVFKRSYSLHFLAQFGRPFDVFPPPAPSAPTAA